MLRLLLSDEDVARSVPEVAVRIASGGRVASGDDMTLLLRRLACPADKHDIFRTLEEGNCWHLVARIARAQPELQATASTAAAKADLLFADMRAKLSSRSLGLDAEETARLLLRLDWGCVPEVVTRVKAVEAAAAKKKDDDAATLNEKLREHRRTLQGLADAIDDSFSDEAWRARTREFATALGVALSHGLSSQRSNQEKSHLIGVLEPSLVVLKTHVDFTGHDFAALQSCLSRLAPPSSTPARPASEDALRLEDAAEELASGDRSSVTVQKNLELRKQVWEHLLALDAYPDGVLNESFKERVHETSKTLARLLGMYYGEEDSLERFKSVSVNGLRQSAVETFFRKPGCAHLDRPLRIYFLAGVRPSSDAVGTIREDILRPDGVFTHHIVFVTGEPKSVQRELDVALRLGNVTLVDRALARRILEAPYPWAPLRQAMLRSIDLEATSPFKSEGHVVESRDIYVGRTDLVRRLEDGRCWAIWGGRRSGKTSLLHHLCAAYQRRKRPPYQTVYLTLEAFKNLGVGESDLAIAVEIAKLLGWPKPPSSLNEFGSQLRSHCESTSTCLLIDELDAYVKPHLDARSVDYQLIRHLRATRNAVNERLVCVFAGFKHLYSAVATRVASDSSYPWQNFVNRCEPLSRLTLDATSEIVREGFVDVLGLDFERTIAHSIFSYTAGHPAFVQHFCVCMLRRLAKRGRSEAPRITEAEVQAVYADAGDDLREPFVRFVGATLDMNLGALERIIIYILAAEIIGRHGNPEAEAGKVQIEDAVNSWFVDSKRRPRTFSELQEAFGFLFMTGMLEDRGARVKMSFPSYVDILRRLEEADKNRIFALIEAFPD
ncbi:MAG: hypothetical protein QM765_38895 [Myxococcales bacterium]